MIKRKFRYRAWDWFIAYLVPQPVWAWWMNHVYIPIRYRKGQ